MFRRMSHAESTFRMMRALAIDVLAITEHHMTPLELDRLVRTWIPEGSLWRPKSRHETRRHALQEFVEWAQPLIRKAELAKRVQQLYERIR